MVTQLGRFDGWPVPWPMWAVKHGRCLNPPQPRRRRLTSQWFVIVPRLGFSSSFLVATIRTLVVYANRVLEPDENDRKHFQKLVTEFLEQRSQPLGLEQDAALLIVSHVEMLLAT